MALLENLIKIDDYSIEFNMLATIYHKSMISIQLATISNIVRFPATRQVGSNPIRSNAPTGLEQYSSKDSSEQLRERLRASRQVAKLVPAVRNLAAIDLHPETLVGELGYLDEEEICENFESAVRCLLRIAKELYPNGKYRTREISSALRRLLDFAEESKELSDITRTRCLIPGFDGAMFSMQWKEALWARFFMGAPQRLRQSVERYSIVKRA